MCWRGVSYKMLNEINVFVHPDGRIDRKGAAQYLGCSPKTLADWATKGIGPEYVMLGGKAFYFRVDLDKFVLSKGKSASSHRTAARG